MENYINVKKVKEELDFVNLAITTKNIDSKNKEDLLNILITMNLILKI